MDWKKGLRFFLRNRMLLLLFFGGGGSCGCVGQTYTFLGRIETKAQYFTTDALRNVYVVTDENILVKYDGDGNEVFRYVGKINGKLGSVDASSPFNILLYYPDFQTLVTLDRSLNETGVYDLYDFEAAQPAAVALSEDNSVWMYDMGVAQLKKFVRETNFWKATDHYGAQFPQSRPNRIVARAGAVYLNVPSFGLYVFDQFGHLEKTLELKDVSDFQIFDDLIVYQQAGEYFAFNQQTLTSSKIALPEGIGHISSIRVEKGRLFVQRNGAIEIFSAK